MTSESLLLLVGRCADDPKPSGFWSRRSSKALWDFQSWAIHGLVVSREGEGQERRKSCTVNLFIFDLSHYYTTYTALCSPPYSPQLHVWAGFENPDMPCYFVETKIPRALGRLHTGRPVVVVTPKSLLQTIATQTEKHPLRWTSTFSCCNSTKERRSAGRHWIDSNCSTVLITNKRYLTLTAINSTTW
jgi:hypothetical protein